MRPLSQGDGNGVQRASGYATSRRPRSPILSALDNSAQCRGRVARSSSHHASFSISALGRPRQSARGSVGAGARVVRLPIAEMPEHEMVLFAPFAERDEVARVELEIGSADAHDEVERNDVVHVQGVRPMLDVEGARRAPRFLGDEGRADVLPARTARGLVQGLPDRCRCGQSFVGDIHRAVSLSSQTVSGEDARLAKAGGELREEIPSAALHHVTTCRRSIRRARRLRSGGRSER